MSFTSAAFIDGETRNVILIELWNFRFVSIRPSFWFLLLIVPEVFEESWEMNTALINIYLLESRS